MRFLNRFFSRLSNLATRRLRDERLREEIESHIASLTEQNIHAGMTAVEAHRHARVKIGAVETHREQYHAETSFPLIENMLMDLRYSLRMLWKSPMFTIVGLITLMLGIGANVVVFGALNAILLQPLHVSEPENLYQIRHKPWMLGRLLTTSYPAFEDLQRRNSTFSGMIGIDAYSHAELEWRNAVQSVSGDEVTGNYFDQLGVQPQLGRFFHGADEHGPNSAPYLVLSDALWRRAFQADPKVVGSTVEFNKRPFTVIGVAPAAFHGTERFAWPDYWIPMVNERPVEFDYLRDRASVAVTVIGRLKPRITPQQATDDLNGIVAELANEYPQTDEGLPLRLIHPGLIGDTGDVIRGFLYGVTVLALLVLAAACANLASLFASRVVDRNRELALRIALGSSRQRLLRQLLTEALMLSLVGGAAGLGIARLLFSVLNRWPLFVSNHVEVTVDARVYMMGSAFALASALLFGIAPARQVWQSSPLQSLKGGPGDTRYFGRFAMRDLLLGAQITMCTLLVTASLVSARGMMRALHVPLGFKPQGAMLADVDLGQVSEDRLLEAQRAVIDAAAQIPGTAAVGAVSRTPFTGGMRGTPIFRPGTTEFKLNNSVLAPIVFEMSPGYLNAAGTRLLAGRDISWSDTEKAPYVAVVNQTFAHAMWGDTPAIGQQFVRDAKLTEVVGVVEEGKYHDLEESPQPVAYLPFSQNEDGEMILIVRSLRPPSAMASELRRTLGGIEPNAPISVSNWTDALESELFPARAATVALGVLGVLAAMLAVTGIFGMAAYSVSRRIKELSIRVALGARRGQVIMAAVGRPIAMLGAGSVFGLLSGVLSRSLLGKIVYQADPRDPLVIGGAVLTMVLLGIVASALPARRALAVDPSELMREE
jgi:predicted permease